MLKRRDAIVHPITLSPYLCVWLNEERPAGIEAGGGASGGRGVWMSCPCV